ncbi:DUF4290 domain-containing protein [Fulvivirgaceae bacterium BMA10]|uniref:DUF4290 domain-containing protein n=1 Tax=Splendidivirga corallicola TaxID=3051826 RepID=A0ABT8KQ72_9BACT|nr:DUF4290 domain-containing protein [Fulvivirgaceae bacterium BMA10]
MNEYNTQRPRLILKEYGRNIQKLAEYLNTVEDPEKRNLYASTLVELMRQINPNIKDNNEYTQKLWDDLIIMSDFTLDIESPYPIPERDVLIKKPERLIYKDYRLKYKHYGRNIELIIEKAVACEDPEEREAMIIYIGKIMKTFYGTWNKEVVSDDVIIDHIKELSKNKLDIDSQKVKDNNLFEVLYKERKSNGGGGSNSSNGGKNRRSGKRRKN